MNAVRDLQDQMREQDEAQSKMTRSTRSWLLYFTLIEAVVLVAMTTWQNLYLKSFFEGQASSLTHIDVCFMSTYEHRCSQLGVESMILGPTSWHAG